MQHAGFNLVERHSEPSPKMTVMVVECFDTGRDHTMEAITTVGLDLPS